VIGWSSGELGTAVALEVVSMLVFTMFVGQGLVGGSTPTLCEAILDGISMLVLDELLTHEAGISTLE
jgi:hypothetical protein